MKITQRLALLREIMLHPELSQAQQRICWFLLLERMNSETSICFCSDTDLAKFLSYTTRSVERAKLNLKKLKILDWTPGVYAGRASSYRFTLKVVPTHTSGTSPTHTSGVNDVHVGRPPTHTSGVTPDAHVGGPTQTPDAHVGRSNKEQKNLFYAKFDSPEWNYWDAFLRKTTGKGAQRDKKGGWHFPTQWPSETKQ